MIISKIPRHTVIDITGGEPFTAPILLPLIKLLLDRKHKVSLITNGSIINEEFLHLAVDKSLFYLMISLDGMKKYHNASRGDGVFESAIELIQKVQEIKKIHNGRNPNVCLKINVLDDNYDEIVPLVRYAHEELLVDQFSFNLMFENNARGGVLFSNSNIVRECKGNSYTYDKSKQNNVIEMLYDLECYVKEKKLKINFKPGLSFKQAASYVRSPDSFCVRRCNLFYAVTTMYGDGKVIPCDINTKPVDIRDLGYDLKKFWSTSSFKNFVYGIKKAGPLPNVCKGCCLGSHHEEK